MINELDLVVLTRDHDEYGLRSGDVGTVIHCYKGNKSFEIEFVTAEGRTVAVLSLTESDVRPFEQSEILHVRDITVHGKMPLKIRLIVSGQTFTGLPPLHTQRFKGAKSKSDVKHRFI